MAHVTRLTRRSASADRWLRSAVKRLVGRVHPEKVILFGSRARGRPGEDSDFDLLVVLDQPPSKARRYELVDRAIGAHRWPLDLLVRRPEEIRSRLRMGDSFMRGILRRGRVLYES